MTRNKNQPTEIKENRSSILIGNLAKYHIASEYFYYILNSMDKKTKLITA